MRTANLVSIVRSGNRTKKANGYWSAKRRLRSPNGITQRGRGKRRGDEMGKDRKKKLPRRLIATPKYQVIMSTARQSLFRQIFMSLSSLLAISPFYPFSFFGKR